MGQPSIIKELRRKRARKSKLAKLRKRYLASGNDSDKKKIWQQVLKVAPWLTKSDFAGNS